MKLRQQGDIVTTPRGLERHQIVGIKSIWNTEKKYILTNFNLPKVSYLGNQRG